MACPNTLAKGVSESANPRFRRALLQQMCGALGLAICTNSPDLLGMHSAQCECAKMRLPARMCECAVCGHEHSLFVMNDFPWTTADEMDSSTVASFCLAKPIKLVPLRNAKQALGPLIMDQCAPRRPTKDCSRLCPFTYRRGLRDHLRGPGPPWAWPRFFLVN